MVHTGHAEQPGRDNASSWLTGTVSRMIEVWQKSGCRLDPAGIAMWSRKLAPFKQDAWGKDRVISEMRASLDRLEASAPVSSGSGTRSSVAPLFRGCTSVLLRCLDCLLGTRRVF